MRGLLLLGLITLSCCLHSLTCTSIPNKLIGVNYGRLGDHLPSPYQSIQLLLSMQAAHVKLYDADPETLTLLSGTNLHVTIMLPNEQISTIASNQSQADKWVRDNILAHYPTTKIRFVLVGNEVFSNNNTDRKTWFDLVPAMRNIKKTLNQHNIHNIKVGTPMAMDTFESTFPPSNGRFRADIPNQVITSLMKFLNGTNSQLFLDVYPYFPWSARQGNITLDFALLNNTESSNATTYMDPVSGLNYTNLLDQMLDSAFFAMKRIGFEDIEIAISETGWPHDGDIDEPGANEHNAAVYNRNVVKKMTAQPPLGTPAKPGVEIPTFLFSLYDENRKPGRGTERHWGMVDSYGTPIYEVDLTGTRAESDYSLPPEPANNSEPYRGNIWCVAAGGASRMEVAAALNSVCRQGNGTCDELAPGKTCYEPVSVINHASYAFSSYWAKFRSSGALCYFNGLAAQTTIDPSHGSCKFPSVLL